MTPTAFKPQNFYDSSLCEALDRLCRASGIVDVNWNFQTKEMSDERRPWFFLDSRSVRREPPDETDSVSEFLDLHLLVTKETIAAAAALNDRRKAFYAVLRPLFLALEEGAITARGFIETGKRQAVQMTTCDPARWGGNWTVSRNVNTAEVSFYTDIEAEEAAATLAEVRLDAPAQAQPIAKPPKKEKGGRGYDDTEYLHEIRRLLEMGEARSVNGAITKILGNKAKRPEGASEYAIGERLRSKFKDDFEVIIAKGKPARVIPRHPEDTRTG